MSVRDVRGLLRAYLPISLVVAAAGLLHRRAAIDAWADDRGLATAPAWLQMAAPLWHAAVPDSPSIANGLVRLVDPLTGASTAGDIRALAAVLAATSAGALFLVLRRAAVSTLVAALLCGVTVASVLPVAAAVSVGHTLEMLFGTALILTWSFTSSTNALRVLLLAAITVLGTLVHASFVAFAAGVWGAEWLRVRRARRARLALIGFTVLGASLLVASWLLTLAGATTLDVPVNQPGAWAIARGLLTGQFVGALQPSAMVDLLSTIAVSLPAAAVLSIPLAVLGFVRRDTRPLAVACGLASTACLVFLWGTWLPDPGIGGAPVRLTFVILIGLGLSWVAAQPGKGAMTLAVLAGALIGLRGFVEPTHWSVPVKTAQLLAFVDSAPEAFDDAGWSADRLAVSRALLAAHRSLLATRLPVGADALAAVPHDRAVIAVGDLNQRSTEARAWSLPFDVPYPSADRFLSAQPERLWMTVAVHGRAADGFCSDLLSRLSGDAQVVSAANPALLARVGRRQPRAGIGASDRLEIEYGRVLAGAPEPVPARVAIEANGVARITINREIAARADQGMAVASFDPWTAATERWLVGPCDRPMLPAIRDPRLATAYVMELDDTRSIRIPALLSEPLRVRFDADDWFGQGWHGSEGRGEAAFRWTGALEAHVNVPVAFSQRIRIRMSASLASGSGGPNALGVSWNGSIVRPVAPWTDAGDWIVPASAVRRGINVFTIQVAELVSPAASGGSTDTRELGAAVRSLSFEPAPTAR